MAVLGEGTWFERTQKDDNSVNFHPTTRIKTVLESLLKNTAPVT